MKNMVIIATLIVLAIASFFVTAGIVYGLCLVAHYTFSFKLTAIVWVAMVIANVIRKVTSKK